MDSIQSTISGKNQVVVPARVRKSLNLKAGDKLLWRIIQAKDGNKAIAESEPKSWAGYARGLGRDIWQNTDIDGYIESLRQEWQSN
jgi:AbrB family looped-hinge helix DNA binding protein